MPNTVTNRQMLYIIFSIVTNYSAIALPYTMSRTAGRGGWLPILIMTFVFAIDIIFIIKLNNLYSGKMIFDYSQEIAGKIFSYLLISLFIIYFIIAFLYLSLNYLDLIKENFLVKTPHLILSIVLIFVTGFIANKGINNVARALEIIIPLYIVISVIAFTVTLLQGSKYEVLPLYEQDNLKNYFVGLKNAILPFLGIEIIFLIPFTSQNKKISKLAFITMIFIGLYYVLIYEACISILGENEAKVHENAYLDAVKLVNIPVIQRLDILYQIFGFAGVFLRLSVQYLAIVELVCRIFKKVKRWIIVLLIGIVLFISSGIIQNIVNIYDIFADILTVSGVIFTIILPIVFYIISIIKKKRTELKK